MGDEKNLRQVTIDTYNQSAQALAEYFRGIGPREKYVDIAFAVIGNPVAPNVLEIGCGDGRDAKVIMERTPNYLGIDVSEQLVKIAQTHVPEGEFVVVDVAQYEFPGQLDIVFAFASLLHLNKLELKTVFERLAVSLKPGGIIYISSKYRQAYTEEVKKDRFGTRQFYYYNADIMAQLAGAEYEVTKTWREVHGNTDWFELVLKKI